MMIFSNCDHHHHHRHHHRYRHHPHPQHSISIVDDRSKTACPSLASVLSPNHGPLILFRSSVESKPRPVPRLSVGGVPGTGTCFFSNGQASCDHVIQQSATSSGEQESLWTAKIEKRTFNSHDPFDILPSFAFSFSPRAIFPIPVKAPASQPRPPLYAPRPVAVHAHLGAGSSTIVRL